MVGSRFPGFMPGNPVDQYQQAHRPPEGFPGGYASWAAMAPDERRSWGRTQPVPVGQAANLPAAATVPDHARLGAAVQAVPGMGQAQTAASFPPQAALLPAALPWQSVRPQPMAAFPPAHALLPAARFGGQPSTAFAGRPESPSPSAALVSVRAPSGEIRAVPRQFLSFFISRGATPIDGASAGSSWFDANMPDELNSY